MSKPTTQTHIFLRTKMAVAVAYAFDRRIKGFVGVTEEKRGKVRVIHEQELPFGSRLERKPDSV